MFFINKTSRNPQGFSKIKYRVFSDENILHFRDEIASISTDMHNVLINPTTTIDEKVYTYFEYYKRIYEKHFPLKNKKVHNKTLSKPWITNDIQKLIKNKNFLYYKKLKQPTTLSIEKYKNCKKDLDKSLKLSKKLYFERRMLETSRNMKDRWDAIRLLINKRKNKNASCPIKHSVLGTHFSQIAQKLNSCLPNVECEVLPSTRTSDKEMNFSFKNVDAHTIYTIINKLNVNKGPGPDEIPAKILKATDNIIAPHLSILFNECLKEGVYPCNFKVSLCSPIFKGGDLDPDDPISYRPISILNAVNKVFERILHDQLMCYIENNDILPNFQFGYRKKHNTSQAVLTFAKEVEKALDNKQSAIAIFMDLSKAFDTVDKDILNKKLQSIGVNAASCKILYDYMSNRSMKFAGDNEAYSLEYGVPQGSILGPLLFLIYIYDMKNISCNTTSIVYADDTNLIVTGNNIEDAAIKANDVLNKYLNYFNMNKLSLNKDKTKYMIFSHRKCSKNTPELTINNSILERVHSIKFLGVVLNDKLDWRDHKAYIKTKISKNIGVLNRCRKILNMKDILSMYNCFILPYLSYCIPLWGSIDVSENDIIKKAQNKVLRIMTNTRRTHRAWEQLSNLKILSIDNLYKIEVAKICHKHIYSNLPTIFENNLMPKLSVMVHSVGTRSNTDINYHFDPSSSLKMANKSFTADCVRIWNEIPYNIKKQSSSKIFSSDLSSHLINTTSKE